MRTIYVQVPYSQVSRRQQVIFVNQRFIDEQLFASFCWFFMILEAMKVRNQG